MRALILVVCTGLIGSSCAGALEARFRLEHARSQRVAVACQELLGDADGDVLGELGGPFHGSEELGTRLAGLLAGPGVISKELEERYGKAGALDIENLLKRSIENIDGGIQDLEALVRLQAGNTAQGILVAPKPEEILVAPVAGNVDGGVAAAPPDAPASAGLENACSDAHDSSLRNDLVRLMCSLRKFRTRVVEVRADVKALTESARSLRDHIQRVDLSARLDVAVQTQQLLKFFDAIAKGRAEIKTIHERSQRIAGAMESVRFEVPELHLHLRLLVDTNAINAALAARVQIGVGHAGEIIQSYAAWIDEAKAIRIQLTAVADALPNDLTKLSSDARRIAEKAARVMARRVLTRASHAGARLLFRFVRASLHSVERQVVTLSAHGYGLGAVAAAFAGGTVDRLALEAGERLGHLIAATGVEPQAIQLEACRALTENDESLSVLGMGAFYQGLVASYNSKQPPKASPDESTPMTPPAEPLPRSSPAMQQLWQGLVLVDTNGQQRPVGILASAGAGGRAQPEPVDVSQPLDNVVADLLADWTSLRHCFIGQGWSYDPRPCDRDEHRSATVQALLTIPEIGVSEPPPREPAAPTDEPAPQPIPGTGMGSSTDAGVTDAPPVGGIDGGKPETPGDGTGASITYVTHTYGSHTIDERLIWFIDQYGLPPVGGGGGGTQKIELDAKELVAEVKSLATQHGQLIVKHDALIGALAAKERQWQTTQFVAALCGMSEGGASCGERKDADSVASLRLKPPKGGLPDAEWQLHVNPVCSIKDDAACAGLIANEQRCGPKVSGVQAEFCGWFPKEWRKASAARGRQEAYENNVTALAHTMRILAQTFGGHEHLKIVVSGRASDKTLGCGSDLWPRLSTQEEVPRCAQNPTAFPCFTKTDQSLTLRTRERNGDLSCEMDDLERAGGRITRKPKKGASSAAANKMLAVLRGWRVASLLQRELSKPGADGVKRDWKVEWESDPPPTGACSDDKRQCALLQSVTVLVFPAAMTESGQSASHQRPPSP